MALPGVAPPRQTLADQLFHHVLLATRDPNTTDPLGAAAPSRLSTTAGARTELREAAFAARARRPGNICLAAGNRGLVFCHGPTWSLVAPATATACPLVVCVDEPRGGCLLIAHPEDREAVNAAALYAVVRDLVVKLFGR